MERTAQAIRNEKSFQYDAVLEKPKRRLRIYWSAGRTRSEMFDEGRLRKVLVVRPDAPKLAIDHKWKTYHRINAGGGGFSVPDFVTSLMTLSGESEQDVGLKRIGEVEARGFRIAMKQLEPASGSDGTATVWVAPDTKLPVLVEFEQQSERTHRLENFRWGVALSAELFDPQPPAEYVDITPAPQGSTEQVSEITASLRTYAEASDGHYPPNATADHTGKTLSDRLKTQLGIPRNDDEAAVEHNAYPRYRKASLGFQTIRAIAQDNFHFNYFGDNVGPADGDKVLMHWELDVGKYRVIYGDLKSTIVTESQLRSLLKPKRIPSAKSHML